MDDPAWGADPVTAKLKDKARAQLGTSGSGNHFVEFGELIVEADIDEPALTLPAGRHVALLSHSGSRGAGATVAGHYSKLAMDRHPELPKDLRHLAWLDLDDEDGQAYWRSMHLMGDYASANHAIIHARVARALKTDVVAAVENHHNFAWLEEHDELTELAGGGGGPLVVHRKGATPAGPGVLGIIPGSMADPGFLVRGRGIASSLRSASHGAGRVMSRRAARQRVTWSAARRLLTERGVTVLSAGLDEVPMVYKDIERVMAQQKDLVDVLARFEPRIVKMAPEGERAEESS